MDLTPIIDPNGRPRRCIVIALDGARYDYMTRFPTPVLNSLAERGVAFRNALVSNGVAQTAPGFASIGTGLPVRDHGILSSSEWYDRKEGRMVYFYDDTTNTVRIDVPTAAERVRALHPEMTIASISAKDRLAILMAGASADLMAFSYREHVFARNRRGAYEGRGIADEYYQFTERTGYQLPTYLQDIRLPRHLTWSGPGFHREGMDAADTSETDQLTTTGALRILENFRPHLFFVGLVATNIVGHHNLPDSPELAHTVRMADEQIGKILDAVDRLGLIDETVIMITSDHGMGQKVRGIDVYTELEQQFDHKLADNILWATEGAIGGFYLKEVDTASVNSMVEAIRTIPHIKGAWWRDDPLAPWYVRTLAHPSGPDVVAIPDRSSVILDRGTGMPDHSGHHGSPYPSEINVMQIFAGPGVRKLGFVGGPMDMDSEELVTDQEFENSPEHRDVGRLIMRLFGVEE